MANTDYGLVHTKRMCKYHIVFTPKHRRKVIDTGVSPEEMERMKPISCPPNCMFSKRTSSSTGSAAAPQAKKRVLCNQKLH